MILIEDIFDRHGLAALREAAAALPFEDGAASAGRLARQVKRNAQAGPGPARDAVVAQVEAALLRHPVFAAAARPKAFARILISRYGPGQAYGAHVDDALMQGARTDLSFTLALTPPEDYEGGALVIQDRVESRGFRLNAGELVLYPSDTLHEVQPVTTGERMAIVGWVTSWIRSPQHRDILFDLDTAIAAEETGAGDREQLSRLARTRSNLLRLWAE
ncbi:PKHD-type hydroxylase [Palleronia salina]|uniref:PKHD-type hydroxylase n=1 Tax=Palleronia salina TaxID=313368 RepID=A0A1M6HK87_9RHOB|nr:Fe2+-dependent dioxygenase [Palleronia salina]SHJ22592.1 PKHD-type hydroxylase [Palleronia salina]